MTDIIKRNLVLLATCLLLLISIQLARLSVKYPELPRKFSVLSGYVWHPMESVLINSWGALGLYWSHYLWLVGAQEELARVSLEKKELEREVSVLRNLQLENEELKDALNFQSVTGHRGLMAKVSGFDPSSWSRTLTIDKGSDQGLGMGMAVVDGPGLVGQLIQVADNWARVLLIDDKASAVGAVLEKSQTPAIVEGSLGRRLKLSYLENKVEIAVGEKVMTSGLDGVYPKGLLIGTISNFSKDPGKIFQEVSIEPATDGVKARFVQVLIPTNIYIGANNVGPNNVVVEAKNDKEKSTPPSGRKEQGAR